MNTEVMIVLAIFWLLSLICSCFVGIHYGYLDGYKAGSDACAGWKDEAKWLRSQLKQYLDKKKKAKK